MLITCWVAAGNGHDLKQAWKIEQPAIAAHCERMRDLFTGGGKAGVIVVQCLPLDPKKKYKNPYAPKPGM
jgi:hypothetical protein